MSELEQTRQKLIRKQADRDRLKHRLESMVKVLHQFIQKRQNAATKKPSVRSDGGEDPLFRKADDISRKVSAMCMMQILNIEALFLHRF